MRDVYSSLLIEYSLRWFQGATTVEVYIPAADAYFSLNDHNYGSKVCLSIIFLNSWKRENNIHFSGRSRSQHLRCPDYLQCAHLRQRSIPIFFKISISNQSKLFSGLHHSSSSIIGHHYDCPAITSLLIPGRARQWVFIHLLKILKK